MLFLTLKTFSATGGIEKICRIAAKAFNEITAKNGQPFHLYSLHDREADSSEPYLSKKQLRAFSGIRFAFVWNAVWKGMHSNTVIISHINLALPAYLIKLFAPKTKLIVMAHGIEVWRPLTGIRKKVLAKADLVVGVSEFTIRRINEDYLIKRSVVINNCIDPFLPERPPVDKLTMRRKLGLGEQDFILLTVSRISPKETNKNYDKVLAAMHSLKPQTPNIHYIMVGKYDVAEKQRLEKKCADEGLDCQILFTGYVPDAELPSYYGCADVYVMPSKKEGFGITFIEAMYYGLPVVGGHRDGSVDALLNGRLGLLVDPDRQDEITSAIAKINVNADSFKPDRKLVLQNFGFETYREKWEKVLNEK